jgi:hypothetical protein
MNKTQKTAWDRFIESDMDGMVRVVGDKRGITSHKEIIRGSFKTLSSSNGVCWTKTTETTMRNVLVWDSLEKRVLSHFARSSIPFRWSFFLSCSELPEEFMSLRGAWCPSASKNQTKKPSSTLHHHHHHHCYHHYHFTSSIYSSKKCHNTDKSGKRNPHPAKPRFVFWYTDFNFTISSILQQI